MSPSNECDNESFDEDELGCAEYEEQLNSQERS
jgi:hypothetical protein